MKTNNDQRTRLIIDSFTDDDIKELLCASSLITNVIRTIDNNIILQFKGGYISPALAIPLLAIQDEIKEKGHSIWFNLNELKNIQEMAVFFAQSGIYTSLNPDTKSKVETVLEELNISKQSLWSNEPHRISLSEIRNGDKDQRQFKDDAFNLLLPIYIERKESEIFQTVVSSIVELYDNALSHGAGEEIYSMAKKSKNGENLIIVYDNGKGIPAAYRDYEQTLPGNERTELEDKDIINWALKSGTSTKQGAKGIPRGLGLPSISDAIGKYQGEWGIASGNGISYYRDGRQYSETLESGIRGTLFIMKVPGVERGRLL